MADLTFLFSLIAIILSSASVILVIIRIGIGLGIEFVEREEIRGMKKEIEGKLNDEWITRLQDFVKSYSEKKVTQETTINEIAKLGEATRHAQIASTLLRVLSKLIFYIVKLVVGIIVGAIIFILLIWGAISFTNFIYSLSSMAFGLFLFLMVFINIARKRIRGYMSLRFKFYELSENPSLTKAKDISRELEEEGLIYA